MKINYCIYPSMLDAFQRYLESGEVFEDFTNSDSEGNYKRTEQEIAEQREQELINLVNRVPFTSEAADRGTCFNAVIDSLNGADTPKGMDIHTEDGMENKKEVVVATIYDKETLRFNTFRFDADLCREVADYFRNAVPQYYVQAPLETMFGNVMLYGYIDEVLPQKICDLKTTSSYKFGNYERKWQRHLYPYCLIRSGEMDSIPEFEYTVVQLKDPTLKCDYITGVMYKEAYTYDFDKSAQALRDICDRFIGWLNNNKFRITDKKVFNEQ